MLTLDLEKTLLKENKQIIIPQELLLINEYEKFGQFDNNDVLNRIGINQNIKDGKSIKNKISKLKNDTKNFNQERVFHISQIENICKKYRLKFLQTKYYKGTIDENLPTKITTSELALNIRCDSYNTFIIAPESSFNLQEKPKDSLFFYKINEEYFYLIHKWGNDLNIFRRLLPLLENPLISWFTIVICLLSINFILPTVDSIAKVLLNGSIFIYGFITILSNLFDNDKIRILPKNNWNSVYKN